MNLHSKFGYCIIAQTLNIALYKRDGIKDRLTGRGVGRVVKLLACGARGLGFDSRSRHLNYRNWLPLMLCKFSIQPTDRLTERQMDGRSDYKMPPADFSGRGHKNLHACTCIYLPNPNLVLT